MDIQTKFIEFKKEIESEVMGNNENLAALEVKMLAPEELFEVGFIHKNVDGFLVKNKFENKDFEVFFDTNCSEVFPEDMITPLQINGIRVTAGNFVKVFKREVVICFLHTDLFRFISDLKGKDSIKYNKMEDENFP